MGMGTAVELWQYSDGVVEPGAVVVDVRRVCRVLQPGRFCQMSLGIQEGDHLYVIVNCGLAVGS